MQSPKTACLRCQHVITRDGLFSTVSRGEHDMTDRPGDIIEIRGTMATVVRVAAILTAIAASVAAFAIAVSTL